MPQHVEKIPKRSDPSATPQDDSSAMYEPATLKEIHSRLHALLPNTTILLGGSYAYGEAGEGSDVDFYAILPWHAFFSYYRLKQHIRELKDSYFGIRFSVMIVPRLFFERGWFYIHGINRFGETQSSPIHTNSVVRLSLKLALFHYFLFLISSDRNRKIKELVKVAQQTAALFTIHKTLYTFQPLFATKTFKEHLDYRNNALFKKILEVLELKQNKALASAWTEDRLNEYGAIFYEALKQFYAENKQTHFGFSLLNYLVYNVRALASRSSLFLRRNPDTMVLDQLLETLEKNPENMREKEAHFTTIVFPILII